MDITEYLWISMDFIDINVYKWKSIDIQWISMDILGDLSIDFNYQWMSMESLESVLGLVWDQFGINLLSVWGESGSVCVNFGLTLG